MMVSVLLFMCLSVMIFHFSAVSAQTFTFSQEATGPDIICEGSDVTLQCVIIQTNPDNRTFVVNTVWSRNGMRIQLDNGSFIPNHSVVFNPATGGVTDLVITDVRLEDNNTVYSCTAANTAIISSVMLNVTGMPSINDLTVRDGEACNIIVSWTPSSDDPVCGNVLNSLRILPNNSVKTENISDTYYIITGLTPNTAYDVRATSSNMAGAVESAEMHTTNFSNSVPSVDNIENTSRICVTYFSISWDPPNSTTCGNVSYEVTISPPPIEGDAVTTTANTFLSITGLNNSLPNVTIAVIASNIAGRGGGVMFPVQLPKSQSAPPINGLTIFSTDARPIVSNTTSACIDTPDNLSNGYEIFLYWTRPNISDLCTTLPISGYFFHVTITYMNGSEKTINASIDDSSESSGAFNVSFTETFDEEVMPDARYCFNVTTDSGQGEDDDDDPIIIIIIIVILGVLLLYSITVVLLFIYLILEIEIYIVSTIIVVVLAILTCGVGHYIGQRLRHYICQRLRHRHGSVQQETEMREKSSDLYDAPVKSAPNQGKDQELYSYARTGPVNVVISGSANS